jgi:hypothetical protein
MVLPRESSGKNWLHCETVETSSALAVRAAPDFDAVVPN